MSSSRGNIILYEGKRKKMTEETVQKTDEQLSSSTEASSSGSSSNLSSQGEPVHDNEKASGTKKVLEVIAAILGILVIVVPVAVHIERNSTMHEEKINMLQEDISEIKENYREIGKDIDMLADMATYDHEIFLQVSSIDMGEKPYIVLFKDLYEVKTETIRNEEYLANPSWNEEDSAIAVDADSDIVYSPEDLYNTPIITSYLDEGNEVYFYGRFNQNNHWNGKCILNVYNENKLVSIFEGVYDDGELFSYQRVISKDDVWIVNDRIYQGAYNSGETWTYSKTDDFVKEFTLEDVKEKQILTVDRFLKSKGAEMLSYYKGRTSNGLFNDDTGRAYYVSYFKSGEIDGTSNEKVIKTLYQGCFSNGGFSDKSGDAWYITRESDTKYMYYEGSFSDRTADNNKVVDFQHGIGYEFISQKLKEKGFEEYETGFYVEYDDSSETVD